MIYPISRENDDPLKSSWKSTWFEFINEDSFPCSFSAKVKKQSHVKVSRDISFILLVWLIITLHKSRYDLGRNRWQQQPGTYLSGWSIIPDRCILCIYGTLAGNGLVAREYKLRQEVGSNSLLLTFSLVEDKGELNSLNTLFITFCYCFSSLSTRCRSASRTFRIIFLFVAVLVQPSKIAGTAARVAAQREGRKTG